MLQKDQELDSKASNVKDEKVNEEDELLSCCTPNHHLRRVYPPEWLILLSNASAWTKPKWTLVINFMKGHWAAEKTITVNRSKWLRNNTALDGVPSRETIINEFDEDEEQK